MDRPPDEWDGPSDPGPELDAAVAEKVMGWKRTEGSESGAWTLKNGDGRFGSWSPSTDIKAAWEVVERVKMHYHDDAVFSITYLGCQAECKWYVGWQDDRGDGMVLACGRADEVEVAICIAALAACENYS